jgi:catechol 2,3-dioxygenase-like lactoylglutathione lyase family enzyme
VAGVGLKSDTKASGRDVYAHGMALVGINHVALEVGSIDEALAFWERLFGPLQLRGRSRSMAFVDLGDQFVALMRAPHGGPDVHRHVGIVVDDKDAARAAAVAAGIEVSPPPSLDVCDPWGNLLQVVDYREIQFTKAPAILAGMRLAGLEKTGAALAELRAKGLA